MIRALYIISLAVLFGACHDTTVGRIHQVENNNLHLLETEVSDPTVANDTTAIDATTSEADTTTGETVYDADASDTATAPETDSGPEAEVVVDPCLGMVCDDHNPCTTDSCVNGSCASVNNTTSCDDGDACTEHDTCSGGQCVGHELDCNDQDTTTIDSCDPAEGCVNTYVDRDYDGYAPCQGPPALGQTECDCDDDGTSGGAPASLCLDDYGYYIVIDFAAEDYSDRPVCSYTDSDGTDVEGILIAETDGSILNGPQIAGHDTPDDGFDNDCDGLTDEDGEEGLNNCDWYGSDVEEVYFVYCSFFGEHE